MNLLTESVNLKNEKIEVSEYSTMKKFDDFLKLLDFHHVERCEYVDCSACLFTINLTHLYVQISLHKQNSVILLQSFCRMRINQFYYCRLFLKTLGALEKQRVLAEIDFHKTLQLWNKPQNPPPPQHPKVIPAPLTTPVTPGSRNVQI